MSLCLLFENKRHSNESVSTVYHTQPCAARYTTHFFHEPQNIEKILQRRPTSIEQRILGGVGRDSDKTKSELASQKVNAPAKRVSEFGPSKKLNITPLSRQILVNSRCNSAYTSAMLDGPVRIVIGESTNRASKVATAIRADEAVLVAEGHILRPR